MFDIKLNLIAGVGKQGQLGLNGQLPWHDIYDLMWFRNMTIGHVLIMGKRTAQNLEKKGLNLSNRYLEIFDGRYNDPLIFLNRVREQHKDSLTHIGIWLAGGEYTYRVFAPHVDGLKLISYIDYDGPADTYFPFEAYGIHQLALT